MTCVNGRESRLLESLSALKKCLIKLEILPLQEIKEHFSKFFENFAAEKENNGPLNGSRGKVFVLSGL